MNLLGNVIKYVVSYTWLEYLCTFFVCLSGPSQQGWAGHLPSLKVMSYDLNSRHHQLRLQTIQNTDSPFREGCSVAISKRSCDLIGQSA
jgi:hypothetical protein